MEREGTVVLGVPAAGTYTGGRTTVTNDSSSNILVGEVFAKRLLGGQDPPHRRHHFALRDSICPMYCPHRHEDLLVSMMTPI